MWMSKDLLFCEAPSDEYLPSTKDPALLYHILKLQSYLAQEVSGTQTGYLLQYQDMELSHMKHEIAQVFYSIRLQLLSQSIYQQLL